MHHVIDDIVRRIVTAEATENRRNRRARQKRHRKLLKEKRLASRGLLHPSEQAGGGGKADAGEGGEAGGVDQIRQDICWCVPALRAAKNPQRSICRSVDLSIRRSDAAHRDFVKSGGKCYRGDACRYTHEMVPLHQIPVKLRFLMAEDTFPESRQLDPEKAAVNDTLVSVSLPPSSTSP